jgi:predicted transcriptional regulator
MDIDEQAGRIMQFLRRRELQGGVDRVRDTAIVEALQVDPTTVRTAVEVLEIRGYVLVSTAPQGGYAVTLTTRGSAAAAQTSRRKSAP